MSSLFFARMSCGSLFSPPSSFFSSASESWCTLSVDVGTVRKRARERERGMVGLDEIKSQHVWKLKWDSVPRCINFREHPDCRIASVLVKHAKDTDYFSDTPIPSNQKQIWSWPEFHHQWYLQIQFARDHRVEEGHQDHGMMCHSSPLENIETWNSNSRCTM